LGERDADFVCAFERIKELRALGMTGRQLTDHLLKHYLAPLQRRFAPAWLLNHVHDRVRLFTGSHSEPTKSNLDWKVDLLCRGVEGTELPTRKSQPSLRT
jgi:hypothetical protein